MSGAITLLPLWAVRPVPSLSACRWVHYNIFFRFNMKSFYVFLTDGNYAFRNRRYYERQFTHTVNIKNIDISLSGN
jgi:hypothetical protein